MSGYQKTPVSRTLPAFTRSAIKAALDKQGKALPATVAAVHGNIVTVSFQVQGLTLPQVDMPLAGAEYLRMPTQVGDKGVCFPADVYIGQMSGLGTGLPNTSTRGNLSTLVFFPIGNKNWTASDNANAVVLYGPDGVILRDSNSDSTLTLTPSDIDIDSGGTMELTAATSITLTVGAHSIVINSSGVTIDGKVFLLHEHSAVTPGVGISGPVVP